MPDIWGAGTITVNDLILDEAPAADLKRWLARVADSTETALSTLLPPETLLLPEDRLHACMRYAVMAGGKRLRPALVVGAYQCLTGVTLDQVPEGVWRSAAAMEMLHTFSLIQDDLPCMDDDDLRRGKPTSHRQFDEATALLASDALHTLSFGILVDPATHEDARVRCRLASLLAEGTNGMVAGQMIDLLYEGRVQEHVAMADLCRLQNLKTGALIRASVRIGAAMAGTDMPRDTALAAYSDALGLAFQIWDDVLDVTADAETLGKTPGKDARDHKTTFVSLLGLEAAKLEAGKHVAKALECIATFGDGGAHLAMLARYVISRNT